MMACIDAYALMYLSFGPHFLPGAPAYVAARHYCRHSPPYLTPAALQLSGPEATPAGLAPAQPARALACCTRLTSATRKGCFAISSSSCLGPLTAITSSPACAHANRATRRAAARRPLIAEQVAPCSLAASRPDGKAAMGGAAPLSRDQARVAARAAGKEPPLFGCLARLPHTGAQRQLDMLATS